MDLFELTKKLIDIPSVTGDEKGVGIFLAEQLESLGFSASLQEVETDRLNVIATTDKRPRVVLSTHMDTVPPFIPSREDETRIFGRGACDAKGIIAAQIMAAARLRAEGLSEIGLLFTVDEELSSLGARVANANEIAPACEYLINGEPTGNKLAIASKGSLRLRLRAEGRACHSAYPEQGESAIEKLLDVLERIRSYAWPDAQKLGQTTCNIGVIEGGVAPNVIPAQASAVLQFRLVTNAADIKREVELLIEGRASVEYLSENDPVHMMTVDDLEQCVVRFTTDIPYLTNWGSPLLIGPGSILVAHTSDEFVDKQELTEAVDLYVRLGKTLLEQSSNKHGVMSAEQ
jgi:acetylornithine deacetylase